MGLEGWLKIMRVEPTTEPRVVGAGLGVASVVGGVTALLGAPGILAVVAGAAGGVIGLGVADAGLERTLRERPGARTSWLCLVGGPLLVAAGLLAARFVFEYLGAGPKGRGGLLVPAAIGVLLTLAGVLGLAAELVAPRLLRAKPRPRGVACRCPSCDHRLRIPDEYVGRRGRCPRCKAATRLAAV